MVDVQRNREHLLRDFVRDAKHLVVVFGGLKSHGFMQQRSRVVTHIHGGVYRQNEKPNPPKVVATQQFGVGAHDQGKRFAVTELVVAPAFKPTEDGMKAFFRVFFQLPKDGDVTRIPNFFGEVGGVINVFGLEEGVGLAAFELAQIDA